jgi:nucleoside phosphorylase
MGAPVAIVSALPEEIRGLRSRLVAARPLSADGRTVAGTIGDREVMLVVTGDGERNAREGIEAVLDRWPIERLIVIGVAGALTANLRPAALVVADEVRDRGGSIAADPVVVRTALHRAGGQRGCVITAERVASSPGERARVLRDLGGGVRTAVVDLESAVLVRAARARQIPWLVLRVVSDSAEEWLPPVIGRAQEPGGGISRGRVLRGLLLAPGAVPSVLALRWRVARGAKVLASATERLLAGRQGTGIAA